MTDDRELEALERDSIRDAMSTPAEEQAARFDRELERFERLGREEAARRRLPITPSAARAVGRMVDTPLPEPYHGDSVDPMAAMTEAQARDVGQAFLDREELAATVRALDRSRIKVETRPGMGRIELVGDLATLYGTGRVITLDLDDELAALYWADRCRDSARRSSERRDRRGELEWLRDWAIPFLFVALTVWAFWHLL